VCDRAASEDSEQQRPSFAGKRTLYRLAAEKTAGRKKDCRGSRIFCQRKPDYDGRWECASAHIENSVAFLNRRIYVATVDASDTVFRRILHLGGGRSRDDSPAEYSRHE